MNYNRLSKKRLFPALSKCKYRTFFSIRSNIGVIFCNKSHFSMLLGVSGFSGQSGKQGLGLDEPANSDGLGAGGRKNGGRGLRAGLII